MASFLFFKQFFYDIQRSSARDGNKVSAENDCIDLEI